jgi:hypothetical protein
MKAQVVFSRYVRVEDGRRRSYRRGDEIEVSKDELEEGLERGALRKVSDADEPMPAPNAGAAIVAPTTPAGEPIETDAEGNPLVAGETPAAEVETVNYRTHKDADERASELGISFPDGTTVTDKNAAINAYLAAQAGGVEMTSENIAELSEAELMERGEIYGLSEDEMTELSRDELVLRVAEAMNARTADPAEQARENASSPPEE